MNKDPHNNRHRAGKKAFQAMLNKKEQDLLESVKKKTGISESRALLVYLLEASVK